MFQRLRAGLKGLVEKVATTQLKAEQIRLIMQNFKLELVENDVALSVADRIGVEMEKRLDGVQAKRLGDRERIVKDNLRSVLLGILTPSERIDFSGLAMRKRELKEPFVVVFVGINGTGKTTSIAKVARFLMKSGFSVVLACADTYRAGSIEQLEEHSRRLGVRMIKHGYGSDPAAVAFDAISHARAHGVNVVLIDTAGRIQTDRNLMNELGKIRRVIKPDLTVLIVDSLTGNDAVLQAEEFHRSVGVDATILTKTDADVRGGSALSVVFVTGKPVLFVGTGQGYDDLEEFEPARFTDMILK